MSSRLHKIGNIYTRTLSLIKKEGIPKPIWFDIYSNFPPLEEPMYFKPVPNLPIREIYYNEDKVRAKVHKILGKRLGMFNFKSDKSRCKSEKMIEVYSNYIAQGLSESEAEEKLLNYQPNDVSQSGTSSKLDILDASTSFNENEEENLRK